MANLIRNGSFQNHADDWCLGFVNQEIGHVSDGGRSEGTGALSIIGTVSGARADYRPGGALATALGVLTDVDAVAYAKAPAGVDVRIILDFYALADDPDSSILDQQVVSDVGVTDTWVELALRDVAVPMGAAFVRMRLQSSDADDNDTVLWSDVYLGAPDGDDPPYAAQARVPYPANRVPNGTLETDARGWLPYWDMETLERDTVDPMAGSASLKVTPTDDGFPRGCGYRPGVWIVVESEEALRFSFAIRGAGEVFAALAYVGGNSGQNWAVEDVVWQDTIASEPQVVTVDVETPPGAALLTLQFATVASQDDPFWLDTVALGSIPGPAVVSASCVNLGTAFGLGIGD